ncbi:MAG: class I SAM-dependent methyltransferase [Actinomycetota bacterium]
MRTHDALYLNEDRYRDVKQAFTFTASYIVKDITDGMRICDFGCAAGEFPFYLKSILPNCEISGMDIMPSLISRARDKVPGVNFIVGDVNDPATFEESGFDRGTMFGVHTIFDDPTVCIGNAISWVRPGGILAVFGLFNPYAVDVFVRVRTPGQPADHREPGWNMISQATMTEYLDGHPKVKSHQYHKFEIGIDLPHQDDPLRSWTERMADDSRQIVNGSGVVHHFYALVIQL